MNAQSNSSSESSVQSSPSAEALSDTAVSPNEERIAQSPDNASLNASPSNSWQSSAQQTEPQGMAPSDASTPGDSQSVQSTPAPKSDRENTPSPEEQSK